MMVPAFVVACSAPRIIDGDTLACGRDRVRLYGVDAPELHGPAHAETFPGAPPPRAIAIAARARLAALAANGVRCTPAGDGTDRYGRTVAVCASTADPDLGRRLVREGLAVDWPRYSAGRYRLDQVEARAAHLGLWARR